MNEPREAELIRAARTLRCMGEVQGFRDYLRDTGETPTGPVNAALLERERAVMPGGFRGKP